MTTHREASDTGIVHTIDGGPNDWITVEHEICTKKHSIPIGCLKKCGTSGW